MVLCKEIEKERSWKINHLTEKETEAQNGEESCRLKSQSAAPLLQGGPRPRGCELPLLPMLTSSVSGDLPAGASQVALVVKNPPPDAGDKRVRRLIPGSGRSPGRGHGSPLQYSCLESPMDKGAWRDTVHGVPQSRTRLKRLGTHTHALCVDYSDIGNPSQWARKSPL